VSRRSHPPQPARPLNPGACAVLERNADGDSVGRCWFAVRDGKCPRHGDVGEVQVRFAVTGQLTDERDLPQRKAVR
jgi:hypothetical protein